MKKFLMKIKVNMLIVLIISLLGGMAGSYFFNNRWLGLIVAIPLCALWRCHRVVLAGARGENCRAAGNEDGGQHP